MTDSRPSSADDDADPDPAEGRSGAADEPADSGADGEPDDSGADGEPDDSGTSGEPEDSGADRTNAPPQDGDRGGEDGGPSADEGATDAELRRRVEEKYDFDDFGPNDMAEITPDEWDAAFDPDSWITGSELLSRVETDLERRVAERDVFAVVERRTIDGEDAVLAFSDEGYALVRGDGSVDGFGTVLRDVKPTIALCSMESYDPEPAPAGAVLPRPDEVPEGSGELGNLMLQIVAAVLGVCGLVLLGAAVVGPGAGLDGTIGRGLMLVFGFLFLGATAVLFFTVANARLSDKFRAEEYRTRLRSIGLADGERPAFLPTEDGNGDPESTVETALANDTAADAGLEPGGDDREPDAGLEPGGDDREPDTGLEPGGSKDDDLSGSHSGEDHSTSGTENRNEGGADDSSNPTP